MPAAFWKTLLLHRHTCSRPRRKFSLTICTVHDDSWACAAAVTAKHGSRDFALGHSAHLQKAPSAKLKLLPPLQVLQDAGKNKGQAPVIDVTKHGIFKVGTAGRSTMAAGILATELEKLTLCCPILAVTSCMAFGTMCALPDAECQLYCL